jgi:hypothetical protein
MAAKNYPQALDLFKATLWPTSIHFYLIGLYAPKRKLLKVKQKRAVPTIISLAGTRPEEKILFVVRWEICEV